MTNFNVKRAWKVTAVAVTLLVGASCTVDKSGIVFDDDLVNGTGGKGNGSGSGGTSVGGDGQGGAGGDSTGTGGSSSPPGACTANTMGCNGKQVQFCNGTGWADVGGECPNGCVKGACTACQPGDTQCITEKLVQTCGSNGDWGAVSSCDHACVGTACGGVCAPGDKQCGGATSKQPQSCDSSGSWVDVGSACTGNCDAGLCEDCTGSESRCSDTTHKQTCSSDLWGAPTACTYICDPNLGDCGGVCVPDSKVCVDNVSYKACGTTSGQYGDPVDCGAQACKNGNCVGVCRPGARSCSGVIRQLCNNDGQWQQEDDCTDASNPAVACRTDGTNTYCGECTNGALSCDDSKPIVCADGSWGPGKACLLKGAPYCWRGACDSLTDLQDACTKYSESLGKYPAPRGCYGSGASHFYCDSRGNFSYGACGAGTTCTNNSGVCN
jgi:hypothetical protein